MSEEEEHAYDWVFHDQTLVSMRILRRTSSYVVAHETEMENLI